MNAFVEKKRLRPNVASHPSRRVELDQLGRMDVPVDLPPSTIKV